MRILLTGATGMVGRSVLIAALRDPEVEQVTALTRREINIAHPKLRAIIHEDFLDYSDLDNVFAGQDACLWCLGVSQTRVKSDAEYERITFDYAINCAKTLLSSNPGITFLFVSGAGADRSESSRTLFARIKGKTENALVRLPFRRLYILRPGGIAPGPEGNPNGPWLERMLYPLHPLLRLILPNYFIKATDLADAMLKIAKHGAPKQLLLNRDLIQLSRN